MDKKDIFKVVNLVYDMGHSPIHTATLEYDSEYKYITVYIFDISKYQTDGRLSIADKRVINDYTNKDMEWLIQWKERIDRENGKDKLH